MSSIWGGILAIIDAIWTSLCRPLVGLLNLVLRPAPGDGRIGIVRVILWIAINCALLAAALGLGAPHVRPLTIGIFLLFHVLIILASLRVMSEEKQVMEGSMAAAAMTFSVTAAVNNVGVLASSIVFYVLGLPALIEKVEAAGLATILTQKPQIFSNYGSYLTCVLNEMPLLGPLVFAGANLSGMSKNINAEIVYAGIAGNAVRLFVVATVGFVIVRAIVLRFQQASHKAAMLRQLSHHDGHYDVIKDRLARLPPDMRAALEHSADTHADHAVRHRLKDALARLGGLGHAR